MSEDEVTKRRKAALKSFFELREERYLMIVNELFRLFEFEDIAKGVLRKYRQLPNEWRGDLILLKNENEERLSWFENLDSNFLTESTDAYPSQEKNLQFPERDNALDKQIDEMILNEIDYYDTLTQFNSYVVEITAIANGQVSQAAKDALGLNSNQVEYIFGKFLSRVYSATESVVTLLGSLELVHAEPRTPGGRAGYIADIISLCREQLQDAYAPYSTRYKVAKVVLENRITAVGGRTALGTVKDDWLNFQDLWSEISETKKKLHGKALGVILMMPFRRLTNYPLFFGQFNKKVPKEGPANVKLNQALEALKDIANHIDREIKNREKIEQKFAKKNL